LDGASDFVRAIDFTQGHDFGDVNPGIEATFLKLVRMAEKLGIPSPKD
jgi:hypothetical protein